MIGWTVSVSDTELVSDTVSVSDRSPRNVILGLKVGSANSSASSSSTDMTGRLRVAVGCLWDFIFRLLKRNLEELEELSSDHLIILESLRFRIEIGKKLMGPVS